MFINIAKTLSPLHPEVSLMTYMGPMNPIDTITEGVYGIQILQVRNTDFDT